MRVPVPVCFPGEGIIVLLHGLLLQYPQLMERYLSPMLFSLPFLFLVTGPPKAAAQEPFVGEIRMFAGNFAPAGWALCNGQLLSISSHSALFSVLGTTYGGDGENNFALPDLRGRVPVHAGSGVGVSSVQLGEKGGSERVHAAPAPDPHPAVETRNVKTVRKGRKKSNIVSAPVPAQAHTGGGGDQENRQPYTGIHFIIALQGIFPSES